MNGEIQLSEVIEQLNSEYIGPALTELRFTGDQDQCFRKWASDESSVCIIIGIYQYKHPVNAYTIELGFFSQFIHKQFGLPFTKKPTVPDCRAGGISYRLESLLGLKMTVGWIVENESDVDEVGPFFKKTVERNFIPLTAELSTLLGWEKHFLQFLDDPKLTGGRGFNWSMYTYAILGQDPPDLVKAERAIVSHENEPEKKRLKVHLDRQRELIRTLKS